MVSEEPAIRVAAGVAATLPARHVRHAALRDLRVSSGTFHTKKTFQIELFRCITTLSTRALREVSEICDCGQCMRRYCGRCWRQRHWRWTRTSLIRRHVRHDSMCSGTRSSAQRSPARWARITSPSWTWAHAGNACGSAVKPTPVTCSSLKKSPGSCYLFNCGPPEDFRCKFTAHGNFSSGVLALSRRLAELQDQERLEHHERELASLRHPTTTTSTTTQTTPSTELPRLPPEPPQPPQEPRPPQPLPRRCSRYQFECRRGGECIAVYNACDGVPQCADGSDEAPELGCPASPAPAAPPEHPPARASLATRPPAPSLPLTQVQVLDSAEDARSAVVSNNDAMAEGPDMWPHRLTQAQPQHRYNSGSGGSMGGSHIFSHKGGLLQENAFEPPAPNAPWPRRAWQSPQTGVDGMEGDRGWGAYGRLDWPDTEPRRAWPVPPRPEPEIPVYMPPKTMPEMPMIYSSQRQTLRDSPKKGFDLINQNQPIDFQTEPPPPPHAPIIPLVDDSIDRREEKKPPSVENTTKKKVLKDNPLESGKSDAGAHAGAVPHDAAAAALEARERWPLDEHDGLSEHPPSAVLLLVLGTLMTAALGGLLACRARAARRRRRAHPRLALDADYLVNGMYL